MTEIKPNNDHAYHTANINPDRRIAQNFDKWARENLNVIEVEDPDKDDAIDLVLQVEQDKKAKIEKQKERKFKLS